jgi:hypothetical protein
MVLMHRQPSVRTNPISKNSSIISGHSLRVGAAQDLLLSGTSLPIIMNRGRWSKTDAVMRHVESAGFSFA